MRTSQIVVATPNNGINIQCLHRHTFLTLQVSMKYKGYEQSDGSVTMETIWRRGRTWS